MTQWKKCRLWRQTYFTTLLRGMEVTIRDTGYKAPKTVANLSQVNCYRYYYYFLPILEESGFEQELEETKPRRASTKSIRAIHKDSKTEDQDEIAKHPCRSWSSLPQIISPSKEQPCLLRFCLYIYVCAHRYTYSFHKYTYIHILVSTGLCIVCVPVCVCEVFTSVYLTLARLLLRKKFNSAFSGS